jgi:hypothetical protein
MSKLNIKRAVENIRSSTTVYTPISETIVNCRISRIGPG